jgi:hypothetical protein
MHESKKNPGGAVCAARQESKCTSVATNKRTLAPAQARSIYVLRLISTAPQHGDDIRRLRWLLKRLLRGLGLRCLSVEEETQP